MNYEVFPFGKYKGVQISELPSNYLMYAVENFNLPIELEDELKFEILNRLGIRKTAVIGSLEISDCLQWFLENHKSPQSHLKTLEHFLAELYRTVNTHEWANTRFVRS